MSEHPFDDAVDVLVVESGSPNLSKGQEKIHLRLRTADTLELWVPSDAKLDHHMHTPP